MNANSLFMKLSLNRLKYKIRGIFTLTLLLISIVYSNAQNLADTLTLDSCLKLALENYPLLKQKALLEEASRLQLWNVTTAYLPQAGLNGQITYQSDVTKIPLKIPGINIPEPDKDMYKFTLDINQAIFDGGIVFAQRKLEKASFKADMQGIEVELYKINDRVNQIYFSILLVQANENLILLAQSEIKSRIAKMESGIRNGIATENNADIMKAELLKTGQQLIEARSSKMSFLAMMEEFINKKISPGVVLLAPDVFVVPPVPVIKRPELQLFELQKQKLDASRQLANTRWFPKVLGFVQLGYGKPGLNMLSSSFDKYYMLGAKLSWNPWNWNQTRNDKKLLGIQGKIIDIQQEAFLQNIRILQQKNISDFDKYEQLMKSDDEIIALRTKIADNAGAQLENGVITATEYITELNNRTFAKLNKELHKIQYINSKINLLNVAGK